MKKDNMKEISKDMLENVNGGEEIELITDDVVLYPELIIDEEGAVRLPERITINRRLPARRRIISGRRRLEVSASRSNPPIHLQ